MHGAMHATVSLTLITADSDMANTSVFLFLFSRRVICISLDTNKDYTVYIIMLLLRKSGN